MTPVRGGEPPSGGQGGLDSGSLTTGLEVPIPSPISHPVHPLEGRCPPIFCFALFLASRRHHPKLCARNRRRVRGNVCSLLTFRLTLQLAVPCHPTYLRSLAFSPPRRFVSFFP